VIDWVVNVHPYLASIIFLVLWCSLGYLEVRFVSPLMGYITWIFATIAASLAVLRIRGLILPSWFLAMSILVGGSASVIYYYRCQTRKHR
jgi:hypothetical protein